MVNVLTFLLIWFLLLVVVGLFIGRVLEVFTNDKKLP